MLASLLAWVEDFGAGVVRLGLLLELPKAAKTALFEAGVLKGAARATSIPCEEHADCAREVRVQSRSVGTRLPFVAVCTREPPECPALDVGHDEVAQASVDIAALARLLAALSHVQGDPRIAARPSPREILRLGRLPDGACEVFFVARPEAAEVAAFLTARDHAGAPARVLVPTARRLPAALASRGEIVVLDDALVLEGDHLVLRGVAPGPRLRVVGGASAKGAAASTAMPPATRWGDVCFERIDNQTVLVRVGERAVRRTCQDFGMANGRNREPKKAWHLFMELLEGRGTWSGRRFGSAQVTTRLVSTLRADLKKVFGIDENPIDDYARKVGWVTRFRVED